MEAELRDRTPIGGFPKANYLNFVVRQGLPIDNNSIRLLKQAEMVNRETRMAPSRAHTSTNAACRNIVTVKQWPGNTSYAEYGGAAT